MSLGSLDLAELERLLAAATPGPWAPFGGGIASQDAGEIARQREHDLAFAKSVVNWETPEEHAAKTLAFYGGALVAESLASADGAFIAAARNALPELLARLRRAEAMVNDQCKEVSVLAARLYRAEAVTEALYAQRVYDNRVAAGAFRPGDGLDARHSFDEAWDTYCAARKP